ncbi:hypothetical protein AMATHDRAFT_68423 [Amanita thiersii Skay4041]|uniref:Uncharacterized protein n=1 Tax=Amanita thiersii Skay4041 TaxID=703135 RepID=A0A2A9N8L1_9AGAR|nr:hypothetical protein AMATHDRAFT_68423 [Amanita thiersii Skay4041]
MTFVILRWIAYSIAVWYALPSYFVPIRPCNYGHNHSTSSKFYLASQEHEKSMVKS